MTDEQAKKIAERILATVGCLGVVLSFLFPFAVLAAAVWAVGVWAGKW